MVLKWRVFCLSVWLEHWARGEACAAVKPEPWLALSARCYPQCKQQRPVVAQP